MRKLFTLGWTTLALLVTLALGTAGAAQINVNFNTISDGTVLVTSFDWNEAGSGIPIDTATGTAINPGDPLTVGQTLSFNYQANLTGMNGPTGVISLPNLNGTLATNYEITATGQLTETVTGFEEVGGVQVATFTITGGTLNIYYDTNVDANTGAGTGFENGTQILTGGVVSGDSIFSLTSPTAGQGSSTTELVIAPLDYDQSFFQTDQLHDLDFTTQLFFPAGTSTTSCFFCDAGGFAPFNVPAGSLLLKADASNIFTAVPEPGSMLLFGSGLLGLVFVLRRNGSKAK